jgi:stage IV sporulation protein FB
MYIGRIAGIPLRLNFFFLVLLVVYGCFGLLSQVLLVFAVVLLHEVGHVLVALSHGLRVKEIELLPFGGVARIDDYFSIDPGVEAQIALAGPLTNLVLAGFVLFWQQFPFWNWAEAEFFLQCNLAMAVVNLLPVLPLDGGRILRARLARRTGYRPATEKIARLGKLVALVCIAGAVVLLLRGLANLNLLILGFFLYHAAEKEQGMAIYVFMRALAAKKEELSREGVLPTEQLVARGETTLKQVLVHILPKRYHVVTLVADQGEITGTVTETDIVNGLLDYGLDASLQAVVRKKKF